MKKYTATVYAPDDYEPKYFGRGSVDFFFTNKAGDSEILSSEAVCLGHVDEYGRAKGEEHD